MDNIRYLEHVLFELAESVGVGEHERRRILTRFQSEVGKVDAAVRTRTHRDHLEARHRRRRGIGAVSAVGDEHFGARLVPSGEVIFFDHEHRGELPVSARIGLQRHGVHSGYPRKIGT